MNQRQQLIALAAALLVATIVSSTEAFQSAATTNALYTSHTNPTKSFVSKRIIPSNNSINNRHNTQHSTQLFVSTEIDLDTIKADEARAKAIAQKNAQLPKTNNAPNNNNDQQQGITNSNDKEWKFFDTARLHVTAGSGGNGCVAFRREKGEAMGGPNGGRGGSGGTVYFIADSSLNTLAGLRNKIHVKAKHGKNGIGKNKDGQHGNDAYVRVPCGTIVRELHTEKVAGELRTHGETLCVARAGRGGRGNAAFMTHRRTAPKFCEHGEPGSERWLSVELRLVADVGFLGVPNAGKSTLLSSSSAAKPKIANYPFTTIVPNLGVCDLGEESSGLVLCDIPGLIEGAAQGTGLGFSFLRHVQRCKVLLHVVDGTSEDPIGDFNILNKELAMYDDKLGTKPQVVVLNKCDVSEVKEQQDELVDKLRLAAGHSRVMTISAATTENCKELMARLKKFVEAEKKKAIEEDLFDDDVLVAEVDFSKAALDSDSDDFEIISDPAYPGQWRVKGEYIEQIAKMTHWEYPEAVERFGRQLKALGIEDELQARGAFDGDLVMIDEYDFDFNPGLTNPYIPQELLEKDAAYEEKENKEHMRAMLLSNDDDEGEEEEWRPFSKGGYMDMDKDEIVEFNDDGDWDLLEDDFDLSPEMLDGDEFWTS
mmetsp:Transcript_17677/g.35384  ORF Transcript_17677/g.35384 Transcript_17677/m.35384 type:complete len:652 (-) Transcript_17677:39-1994(-)